METLDAEIRLDTDFESATLDLQSTQMEGSDLFLVGEESWTRFPRGYRSVYFRATGVQDQQLRFEIGGVDNIFLAGGGPTNSGLREHRYFYSYDQSRWHKFDNGQLNGFTYRFSNDDPFVEDSVFISYSVPYPYSRTVDKVAAWSTNPYVAPTASADENLILGTIPNTRTFGPSELDVYGFKITDGESAPSKPVAVLLAGNHSGEMGGNWGLEGTVDFLLSDDVRAARLRAAADILVYPQLDPLGRVEGYYRNNSQNPAVDHNRAWDAAADPGHFGFAEVEIVRNAIIEDSGGEPIDLLVDYHGFWDSGVPNFLIIEADNDTSHYVRTLRKLAPDLQTELFADLGVKLSTLASFTVEAEQTYVPEFRPDAFGEDYLAAGQDFAIALYAEFVDPLTGDLVRDGILDAYDIDMLTREIHRATPIAEADVNVDGEVDALDREFWIAHLAGTWPGDTNLDQAVDLADFLALSETFGSAGGWASGDFDGNDEVEFIDFLMLSANYGRATIPSSVPEPGTLSLTLTVIGCVMIQPLRRRRGHFV